MFCLRVERVVRSGGKGKREHASIARLMESNVTIVCNTGPTNIIHSRWQTRSGKWQCFKLPFFVDCFNWVAALVGPIAHLCKQARPLSTHHYVNLRKFIIYLHSRRERRVFWSLGWLKGLTQAQWMHSQCVEGVNGDVKGGKAHRITNQPQGPKGAATQIQI